MAAAASARCPPVSAGRRARSVSTRTTAINGAPSAKRIGWSRGCTLTLSPRRKTVRARKATPVSGPANRKSSGRSQAHKTSRAADADWPDAD